MEWVFDAQMEPHSGKAVDSATEISSWYVLYIEYMSISNLFVLFVYAGHVNLPSIIILADFIGYFVHWLCTEKIIFIIIIKYDGLKLS